MLIYQLLSRLSLLTLASHVISQGVLKSSYERNLVQYPCTRIFSSSGSAGCGSTTSSGSVGVLVHVEDAMNLIRGYMLTFDFVAVMTGEFFNETILTELQTTGFLVGVIVYDRPGDYSYVDSPSARYSVDVTTPQGDTTASRNLTINPSYAWNQYGNGLMEKTLEYPVVRADAMEIDMLLSLCDDNSKNDYQNYRINSAELSFYMGAAGLTSRDCLTWKDIDGKKNPQCLPIGGQSVWGTLGNLDKRPKVLLTVAFDTTAEFHDLAFGSNEAMASLAVALIVSEALSRTSILTADKQPMIFLANADEWGYAGSRRFVKDITSFSCSFPIPANQTMAGLPMCLDPIYPTTLFQSIKLSDIDVIIAIDQITRLDAAQSLYVHHQPVYSKSTDAAATTQQDLDAVAIIVKAAENLGVVLNVVDSLGDNSSYALPPTPLTSFIRAKNDAGGCSFSALLLAGYKDFFNDPTYHTRLDSFENGPESMITEIKNAARVTLAGIIALIGGTSNVDINDSWSIELIDCLYGNWSCPLMNPYVSSEMKNIQEYLNYTSEAPSSFGKVLDSLSIPIREPLTQYNLENASRLSASFYTGALNSRRQPLVLYEGNIFARLSQNDSQGSHRIWDDVDDKVFVIPVFLEAFIRSFLSYHLSGDKPSTRNPSTALNCNATSDCGACSSPVADLYDVHQECILNVCLCPAAYYHLALDIGLEAHKTPGIFEFTSSSGIDSPGYTEAATPSVMGVRIFSESSSSTGYIALIFGLLIFAFGYILSLNFEKILKIVDI